MLKLVNKFANFNEVEVICFKSEITNENTKINLLHAPALKPYVLQNLVYRSKIQRLLNEKIRSGQVYDSIVSSDPAIKIPVGLSVNPPIIVIHFSNISYLKKIIKNKLFYKKEAGYIFIRYGITGFLKNIIGSIIELLSINNFKTSRIIAVSEGMSKDISENNSIDINSITVIHNSSDDSISDIHNERDIDIITVAHGDWGRKGIVKFLEIASSFREKKIVVVGGGNLNRMREIARTLNADNVEFVGYRKNVRDYMDRSKVYVSTSVYEAFPLVFLEAASSGCVLASTVTNGVEDWQAGQKVILEITENNYYLNDLKRLLDNQEFRKDQSIATMRKLHLFSESNMIEKYADLLKINNGEGQK
ncbi:glycosyltransferase family 4 protein [Deinococcus sp. A31D244]|uniref:glycosyltransferase family 4 protein n=1 Tax=Deinococcus sp. A31D244 TaxID=3397675 RepID=UPI0039E16520